MSTLTMRNGQNAANEVLVSDTFVAAWIQANGHRPVRISGTGSRKAFVFRDVPQDLFQEFLTGAARVDPQIYSQSYRSLLRMLHSAT